MCFTIFTGLEEVMEFLERSLPGVEIAVAHGKVIFCQVKRFTWG